MATGLRGGGVEPAGERPWSTSSTRVDLPAPLTPVTAVTQPRGMSTSMSRRLCSRAPQDPEGPPRRGGGVSGTGMLSLPTQVAPGQAPVDRPRRALVHEPSAEAAGALPEVHDVVGGADRLLVVLHHHHGVARGPGWT